MIGVRTLDRYVFGSWLRIFVLTALGFPLVSILINLTDTLNRLLDRGLTMREIVVSYVYSIPENVVHRDAGGGAVRHGVHRRRDGPALRAHRGQGRRHELPPADAARSSLAAVLATGLAFVVGELAPGATAQPAGDAEGEADPLHPLALQLRLPRRPRAGCTPSGRSTSATVSSSSCMFERAGQRGAVSGARHHGRQRQLERHHPALAGEQRHQPGHRRGRASRPRSASAPCGSGRSPSRRPTCWPSRRRPTRCATRSSAATSTRCKRSGNDANKLIVEQVAQAGAAGHLPHHRPVRRAAGGTSPRAPVRRSASRSAWARP